MFVTTNSYTGQTQFFTARSLISLVSEQAKKEEKVEKERRRRTKNEEKKLQK
jgi:hypothetical protein